MKYILIFLVLISFLLSSCGDCTTGKVTNNRVDGDKYYLTLAVEENFVFTGELRELQVSKFTYIQVAVGNVVTICE